jgi:hypothetical protein
VPGLRIVEKEEIRQIEPFCEGIRAIHVPTAGIVDYLLVVKVQRKMEKREDRKEERVRTR